MKSKLAHQAVAIMVNNETVTTKLSGYNEQDTTKLMACVIVAVHKATGIMMDFEPKASETLVNGVENIIKLNTGISIFKLYLPQHTVQVEIRLAQEF